MTNELEIEIPDTVLAAARSICAKHDPVESVLPKTDPASTSDEMIVLNWIHGSLTS